jgi:hypothetical protein
MTLREKCSARRYLALLPVAQPHEKLSLSEAVTRTERHRDWPCGGKPSHSTNERSDRAAERRPMHVRLAVQGNTDGERLSAPAICLVAEGAIKYRCALGKPG